MIDPRIFISEWRILEERFGSSHTTDVVRRYLETLDPILNTEGFVQASRSLFAQARFFPSPGEFLSHRASHAWIQVQECVAEFHPPEWRWGERWLELDPATRKACEQLGGIAGMKRSADRDVVRLRDTFCRVFVETSIDAGRFFDRTSLPSTTSSADSIPAGSHPAGSPRGNSLESRPLQARRSANELNAVDASDRLDPSDSLTPRSTANEIGLTDIGVASFDLRKDLRGSQDRPSSVGDGSDTPPLDTPSPELALASPSSGKESLR